MAERFLLTIRKRLLSCFHGFACDDSRFLKVSGFRFLSVPSLHSDFLVQLRRPYLQACYGYDFPRACHDCTPLHVLHCLLEASLLFGSPANLTLLCLTHSIGRDTFTTSQISSREEKKAPTKRPKKSSLCYLPAIVRSCLCELTIIC